MTNLTTWRYRYSQFLVFCILGIFAYIMFQSLDAGVSQFETNMLDRSLLISIFTKIRLRLGDHVFSQALVGKDGWLQYTGSSNLDDFQNTLEFSPEIIQQKSQSFYEKLQARHITFLIVIAPNKATIYPEKVPDEIQKIREQSRLDLLVSYFKQHGPPILVDLRPALQEARHSEAELLYYKTDTHWNALGAFAGYTEIMRILAISHPELTSYKLQDFRLQTLDPDLRDIPHLMGATSPRESALILTPKFNSETHWMTVNDEPISTIMSRTPNERLPRLLMIGDSFGIGLRQFLAPNFREATFVSNNSKYSDLQIFNLVDQLTPDVVIFEMVERNMGYVDIK
jgi:alginate O-acetyltransferase complex protein AlgJ